MKKDRKPPGRSVRPARPTRSAGPPRKTRGPAGRSVLPRAANDEREARPRGDRARSAAARSDKPRTGGSRFEKPRTGGARFEKPRTGGARFEKPRTGGARFEKPRSDRPRTGAARFDKPRPGGPRYDKPGTDRPRTGGPRYDNPRTGSGRFDKPRIGGPRFEKPGADRPRTGAARFDKPRTGGPRYEKPGTDRPRTGTARFDKPRTGTARFDKPRTGAARFDKPATDRSRTDGPRYGKPRSERPRTGTARFDKPRTGAARFDKPRTGATRFDKPRTERPASDRPRSDGPRGYRPSSDRPRPAGPRGYRPSSDRPRAGKPAFDKPRGERPRFDKSRFETPREDRPSGDRPRTGTPRAGATGLATAAPQQTRSKRVVNVRDLALQVLFQVDVKRAFAERVIEELNEQFKLERRDRGLLNELVKGTLRRRGTLDGYLNRYLHVGLSSLPPWIQNALRLGAYQLVYLDRIPARAAVDETVKLALKYGHPGTAGLANSVLRRISEAVGMRELDLGSVTRDDGSIAWDVLSATTSHPRWLLERWVERYGVEETMALCEANNRTAALGLRPNRLKLDSKELIKRLQAAELEATPGRWSGTTVWVEADADFANFPAYARGDCTVQDESETLVGLLVTPRPGERILDLCAAPGGKTTHLAELMGDQGEIVAVEKLAPRARTLQRGIDRLGLHSISVHVADGAEANLLPLGRGGLYDRAIVDAPCSGLGVLARRADARWRKEASGLAEMAELQGRLLRAAAEVVRPGGVLVYSVCSFEPEETDAVVASFLAGHPEWSKDDAASILPPETVEPGGAMRLLPHRHGTDGAFAVRLIRASEG